VVQVLSGASVKWCEC